MKFNEKLTIACRGANNPEPDEPVNGTLLVGETGLAHFEDNHSSYGNDYCSIYPAYHNGQRAFLLCCDWDPAPGYSASGAEESILSMEEGIKLLIEKCQWEFFSKDN